MTSLMPETIEPATGTLPLPKAKTPRKSWTQAEVVALVLRYQETGTVTGEEQAKLIELGIIPKAEKPALRGDFQEKIDGYVDAINHFPNEGQRLLGIRHAIKALSALLPKRAPK
jgi:hypothetical protein